MLPTITEAKPDPTSRVLVLNGHGVSAKVTDGQLRLEDGMHRSERRRIILDRATTKLDRLVILLRDGWLSFEVFAWCAALDIQVVLIDRDGNASTMTNARSHDARLRRAQALASGPGAAGTDQGTAVARYLLGVKCRGQRENLLRLGYDTPEIQREVARVETATTMRGVLSAESRLAGIYWDCLAPVELAWQERKNGRKSHVPEHWRTVGPRISPRTGKPRGAITPAHAILNYLYRLAEVETTIALHAVGLDPAIGIVHADRVNRDSMSLDVLEAIRPTVDAYLLDFLEARTFGFGDVAELPTGEIRLSTPLRQQLTETLPLWRSAVAPVAEHVANLLRPPTKMGKRIVRSPLTNTGIRAANETMRARRLVNVPTMPPQDPSETPASWEEILPLILTVPTETLVAATGLSSRYIRYCKAGEERPARKHWYALHQAGAAHANAAP